MNANWASLAFVADVPSLEVSDDLQSVFARKAVENRMLLQDEPRTMISV